MRTLSRLTVAALFAVAGCATSPSPELPTHVTARTDDQGAQRVVVVADSYWFRPSHVVVKVDTPVELTVHKRGRVVPHSFVLDAPQAGMTVRIPLGAQPRSVRFVPTRAGTYTFYCDESGVFGNHRRKGMQGVLEVVD